MSSTAHSTGSVIAKGAFVNILGAAGKGLIPVYFILITRLYGPETMGLFYMIYVMVDMAVSLTVSGLNDGVVMFTSRFAVSEENESKVYDIIANGFVISLAISVLIIVFAYFGGPELILMKYPDKNVVNSVQSIVWSLPFVVIPVIVVSATKSHLTMKWDAILLGFLRSFALIIFSVLFYFTGTGLGGLIWAFNISAVVVTVCSLIVFGFYFDYGKLFKSVLSFRVSMPLVKFSIPQNLNMTFNTFITNVDVVMLGFFGVAPQIIAFYGMGSQIVRAIRQVKLAFSGSYSPVIARMYGQGDIEKMNFSFSMVSRWTTMISFPLALIVIMFRNELLRLFHPSFTSDTTFMLLLLAPPLLSCMV
ncbi:MAG TPA: oligosaccharide flippase family protein, partial [bacterium]|nr:oligosaccharide flippase family protein [bacterium]